MRETGMVPTDLFFLCSVFASMCMGFAGCIAGALVDGIFFLHCAGECAVLIYHFQIILFILFSCYSVCASLREGDHEKNITLALFFSFFMRASRPRHAQERSWSKTPQSLNPATMLAKPFEKQQLVVRYSSQMKILSPSSSRQLFPSHKRAYSTS